MLTFLPYIVCNEQRQDETLKELSHLIKPGGLHVGFSVWFNLDIIAETKSAEAHIFDINPDVHKIYAAIETVVLKSETIKDFNINFKREIKKLLPIDKEEIDFFNYQFDDLCNRKRGFLATKENYDHVRKLIQGKRIKFGELDIMNQAGIKQLKNRLSKPITTLYISNIPEWILKNDTKPLPSLKVNLRLLLAPNTNIIDAFYPIKHLEKGSGPPLRITQEGQLPSFKKSRRRINPAIFKLPRYESSQLEVDKLPEPIHRNKRTRSSPPGC